VLAAIEPQRWHGDDVYIEALEVDAGGTGDALQALAHDVARILGGIEQHGARLPCREPAQAARARSDGEGEIEGEEGLPALRLATYDADGLRAPETLDQPLGLACLRRSKMRGARRWQRFHGRAPRRRGLRLSGAKTSK
jgi:hypothetical protein